MSDLRAKAVSTIRLNKPLVAGIVTLVGVIIAVAIIEAFSPPSQGNANAGIKALGDTKVATANEDAVKALPSSYQDRSAINRYLNTGGVSPAVQQALDQLRAEQAALAAKFKKDNAPGDQGQQSDQAKTSGLFFPGTAPEVNAMKGFMPGANNANAKPGEATDSKSGSGGGDSYELQNMQVQKLKFLMTGDKPEDIYNKHSVVKPISPFIIQAGTIIPANLITAVNSSVPGNIVAQVRDDVYDTVTGQHLLIPKGSRLIGQYDSQVAYGQERVLAAFTRLIRPDGTSIQLDKFVGGDSQGTSGLTADVDNHWGKVLGAAVVSTMLSVGAGIASDRSGGNNNYYQNTTQSALGGAAAGVTQTGNQITGRAINVQPTLTVPSGSPLNMVVNKDIVLDPYQSVDGIDN